MSDRELPREPGWYRLAKDGWEWIAPPETRSRDLPGDPFALVLVERSDYQDVELW